MEILGFKKGLFVSTPPFSDFQLSPSKVSKTYFSFSSEFFMSSFSCTLFLSCLIRPYSPLLSHTTLQTVNPQCWLGDDQSCWDIQTIFQGKIPTDEYWHISIELTEGHILWTVTPSWPTTHTCKKLSLPVAVVVMIWQYWVLTIENWPDLMFGFDSYSQKCFQEHKNVLSSLNENTYQFVLFLQLRLSRLQ